jgi:cytochrome c
LAARKLAKSKLSETTLSTSAFAWRRGASIRPFARAALATCALLSFTDTGQAAGDPAKGAAVFVRQCALCHTLAKDAPNAFGPNLFGITERKAGTAPGYDYSPAFKAIANWTWSADGVASFAVAPGLTIPGNRMGVFPGVADRDVDDLTAYLATQK